MHTLRLKLVILSAISVLAGAACSTAGKSASSAAAPTVAASPAPSATPSPTTTSKAASGAKSDSGTEDQPLVVRCSLKGDSRTITVVPTSSGCQVHYQKFGKDNVAASSSSGTAHCDKVQAQIKGNLVAAGFDCK